MINCNHDKALNVICFRTMWIGGQMFTSLDAWRSVSLLIPKCCHLFNDYSIKWWNHYKVTSKSQSLAYMLIQTQISHHFLFRILGYKLYSSETARFRDKWSRKSRPHKPISINWSIFRFRYGSKNFLENFRF